jgi:hypothetical protein
MPLSRLSFWNITASYGEVQVFSSLTVLNDSDYVSASLPYMKVHLGTNYTLTDAGLNATTLSTNNATISITTTP